MRGLFNTIIGIALVVVIIIVGFTDNGLNDYFGGEGESIFGGTTTEEVDDGNTSQSKSDSDTDKEKPKITDDDKVLKKDEAFLQRVIDGDTIIVLTEDGVEERVRLLLIDTPESVHPDGEIEKFGPESSDYAKEYFKDIRKVTLEIGEDERDKYDRLLAHVWVDGENFNLHMVEEGWARVAYVYEPNTKYVDEFREAEQRAKEKGLNIWSIDGYVTENDFDMSVVD